MHAHQPAAPGLLATSRNVLANSRHDIRAERGEATPKLSAEVRYHPEELEALTQSLLGYLDTQLGENTVT